MVIRVLFALRWVNVVDFIVDIDVVVVVVVVDDDNVVVVVMLVVSDHIIFSCGH